MAQFERQYHQTRSDKQKTNYPFPAHQEWNDGMME
jgi:hypothetical protein